MKARVTLSEVARAAGVSEQTVSNVVNERPVVRPETRELVLKHLAESGYRRNALARSLKTNTSNLIGLVVPSMTNSMYAEVAESVVYQAERSGYTVMMAVTKRDPLIELEVVNTIIDHRAAGILMSPSDPDALASHAAIEFGVPYVEMLNRGLPTGCDVFEADNRLGARVAVQHLVKLGHRSVAYVGGLPNSTGLERCEGYREALSRAGIAVVAELVASGQYTRSGGAAACEQLLSNGRSFSAIFCASDLMAYGAMDVLAARGISVPNDMSIVGFDDMAMSSLPGIDLTTVSFMPTALAERSVDRLISAIETPSITTQSIHDVAECSLVVRGSSTKFEGEVLTE
jgi:LacI family transcriptional regulator